MLKSPEYSNCHEPLSQEWINGRYRTSKQYMLHKTKHTSSIIFSHRVGLDAIATSYLVGWIE